VTLIAAYVSVGLPFL